MTQSRFYQLSLFFPLILWILGLLVFSFANKEGYVFIIKHMFDAVRVFVPYLIFAFAAWKLAANKTYRLLMLMAVVLPIIWGVFFMLCYLLNATITDQVRDLHILLIMAFWATVVAYLAEIIPLIVLAAFKNDFRSEPLQTDSVASLEQSVPLPEN